MVNASPQHDRRGSCFGFQVCSEQPFQLLRCGGGVEPLHVRKAPSPITAPESTLIAEWIVRDTGGEVTTRLYGADGVFQFWTNDAGWFRVDPVSRAIDFSEHDNELRREQRLCGVPMVLCFMERGDFGLHAAAVEVDGAAILLAAPGRHGKTTLSLAFHEMGYRLLTEDTACCRLGSEPLLLPGPTSVRLRPDTFRGEAPAGTHLLAAGRDRIHLALDPDRAGSSLPVPIRALVFLREPADEIRLERLQGGGLLPDLWTLNFHLQNRLARSRSFTQLAQLAGSIPVWNLHRPLALTNLHEVVSRIVEVCG